MVPNSDTKGSLNVGLNDFRVTKFGKFLRSSKIDEIPQLINVFLGQMSLVGPRPDLKAFTDLYNKEEIMILSIKPGITDWASLLNVDQYKNFPDDENLDQYFIENIRPNKVKLQIYYLKNKNFFLDLEILIWTFLIVFLKVKFLPNKITRLLK
jgi:lipopolysaccharide/colanic/teichoic acid biosynthesis glycosyltransferase